MERRACISDELLLKVLLVTVSRCCERQQKQMVRGRFAPAPVAGFVGLCSVCKGRVKVFSEASNDTRPHVSAGLPKKFSAADVPR